MTDIVELKSDGVVVYPKTHVSAVEGITTIKGEKGETGPAGPQGLTGAQGATGPQGPAGTNATTTAAATQTVNGLMSAADKKKLDTLPTITFNKVGSV
ncbi:collagen-like protein [Enterococcus sp. DIV0242_7C1]|uniref:Collagen-like protein n=1 Tax=Candidatus Enterococcus dunnyi TaxID=1834192 RepID=A0A200J7J4_9ENTE|nr:MULTISPECIES: collagen-like protein [unclassified Enterococcus]MBO0470744.1 collagen-like protein [Enterococcus sp. DIV0242_7C1]OUZ33193.1 hypothetical protein A5889_001902 [Enterococcus sp. 9D6_DIV0238]